MPFTLAHPAAILPLRRHCPRFLNFSALVAGSVAPDAGYCFGHGKWDELSHSFIGGFTFCLPVGILLLIVFYALRGPVLNLLPVPQRELFAPFRRRSIGPPAAVVVSLMLGIWSHLFWDSFTHTHGWLVEHLPPLQIRVASVGKHPVEVCHLLWYASSFAGVAWLCLAYEHWLQAASGAIPVSGKANLRNAIVVGVLVLPIEALHHLIRGPVGIVFVGVSTLLLMTGVVLAVGNNSIVK